jgi:hypothetical protein
VAWRLPDPMLAKAAPLPKGGLELRAEARWLPRDRPDGDDYAVRSPHSTPLLPATLASGEEVWRGRLWPAADVPVVVLLRWLLEAARVDEVIGA